MKIRCSLCGVQEGLQHNGGCADQNPIHPDGMIVRMRVPTTSLGEGIRLPTPKKKRYQCGSGEKHHNARMTNEVVLCIRRSTEPQKVLAERYGVNQSQISRVRSRNSWRVVT